MNHTADATPTYDTRADHAHTLAREARRDFDAARGTPGAQYRWFALRSLERLLAAQRDNIHRRSYLEGEHCYCTCGLLAPTEPLAFARAAGHRSFDSWRPAVVYIAEAVAPAEATDRRHLVVCATCDTAVGPLTYDEAKAAAHSHQHLADTTAPHGEPFES